MAKQGTNSQGSGNGWILLIVLFAFVVLAFGVGEKAVAFVFHGTPHMTVSSFLMTLVSWNSTTLWHTASLLPHPLEWHLLGAAAVGATVLCVLIVAAYAAHRIQATGGDLFSIFGGGKAVDKNSSNPAKWLAFEPKKFRAYEPVRVIAQDEVRPTMVGVPKKQRKLEEYGLLLGYAKNDPALPIALSAELSVLVAGEPRSGKTAGMVIPWVLSWRGPLVTTSTRNEVMRSTLAARRRISEHVYVLCLPGTWIPEGVEPISYDICWFYEGEWKMLVEAAKRRAAIFSESVVDKSQEVWGETTKQLFSCLLLIGFAWRYAQVVHKGVDADKSKPSLSPFHSDDSHMHVLQELSMLDWAKTDNGVKAVCNFLLESIPDGNGQYVADYVRKTVRRIKGEVGGTEFAQTVIGLLQVALGELNDAQIAAVFSTPWDKPVFDPDKFLDDSGTLYLISRDEGGSNLAKYFSLVVNEISSAARRRQQKMKRCDPPLALILDEVANIAPLPNLRSYMSEGGGTGITTVAFIQNLTQLVSVYGDVKAKDIVSSANVVATFGGTKNMDDLAMFTAMAGNVTVQMGSYDDARNLTGRTDTVQTALDATQLANMKDGWIYVRVPGAPVMMVKTIRWFDKPSLKDRGGKFISTMKWKKEWGDPFNEEIDGYPFHGTLRSLSYQAAHDLAKKSQVIPVREVDIEVPYQQSDSSDAKDKDIDDEVGVEQEASYAEEVDIDDDPHIDDLRESAEDEDIEPEAAGSTRPFWETEKRARMLDDDGIDRLFGSVPREAGPMREEVPTEEERGA
jgi:type IV secretory pathway TraG/TraD family ATPase VirD4